MSRDHYDQLWSANGQFKFEVLKALTDAPPKCKKLGFVEEQRGPAHLIQSAAQNEFIVDIVGELTSFDKLARRRLKRALRRLAAAAYEKSFQALVPLLPLHTAFERWARGELSSGEVSNAIDQFHQRPARELLARYNSGILEEAVAMQFRIVAGFIDRAVVPPEVWSHLGRAIAFYESQREAS